MYLPRIWGIASVSSAGSRSSQALSALAPASLYLWDAGPLLPRACIHAVVGILFQQALALEAAVDALYQVFQFGTIRRLDTLEMGQVVVAGEVYPIQKQNVKATFWFVVIIDCA
jgi:hypothetical protein